MKLCVVNMNYLSEFLIIPTKKSFIQILGMKLLSSLGLHGLLLFFILCLQVS